MKCGDFQDRISKFLENEVTERERVQMDQHTSGCPDCEASLEEVRLMAGRLSRLTRVQPSVGFDFALRSRLLLEAAESVPLLRRLQELFTPAFPKLVWSVATVAILAIAATLFLEDQGGKNLAQRDSVKQLTIVAPPAAQSFAKDRQGALRRLSQEASYPISQRLYSSRSDSVSAPKRKPVVTRGVSAEMRKVSFRF
jgi:anti-sigma factor RsiW